MNKLVIPTILTATVLIAGIFSFMPIDKATTVHDSIIGSGLALIIKSDNGTGITDADRIVLDCDKDFTVREIYFTVTNLDVDEQIDMGTEDGVGGDPDFPHLEIDGVKFTDDDGGFEEQDFLSRDAGQESDPAYSWTGLVEEEDEEEYPYILFAEGEGTDDIIMYIFDDGTNPLDGDEDLFVKALFVAQSDAVCTVNVDT